MSLEEDGGSVLSWLLEASKGKVDRGLVDVGPVVVLEARSAGILVDGTFMPKVGVFVDTGTGSVDELFIDEDLPPGSGGNDGKARLFAEGGSDDGGEGNVEGIRNGDALLAGLELLKGKLVSNSLAGGNEDAVDCPNGDGLLEEPNVGAGELLKASKPVDALIELLERRGPFGPETSGKVSVPTMFSISSFNGVSVPLRATYPPYKTKSNNTTTTAVLMVCTMVLRDRKFI